jgi:predicted ATPase
VEICRHVEGLPLALELAATWTRVMPCAEIAAHLREGADLLRADDASHPSRHASLESVFDQSWQILSASERDALARLSVFHGGFTAEAARAVAGAAPPVLAALVDKSLLRREGARLRMHALVQEFAAGRLAASGGVEASRQAHATHYLRFMAQLRRHMQDGKREALQSMEAELENCRAAWSRVLERGPADAIRRGVPTLLDFCDHRFRLDDGLELMQRAVDSPTARKDPALAALLAAAAAHLLYRVDRYAEAEARARAALEAAGEGDTEARLQRFKVLGSSCLRLGRLEEARGFFRDALREAPATVDPNNAAAMLDNLALVEKSMGHYAQALRLSHQSLLRHRALDDTAGEALCLNNLGALTLDRGEHEAAREHLREGLALCEKHGLVATRALILANLTELAVKVGDADAAEFHAHRALELVHATGNRALASWLKVQTAVLALRRGDFGAARSDLAAGLEAAIALRRPASLFGALDTFADLLAAQGEREAGAQVLRFIATHPSSPPAHRDHARSRLRAWPEGARADGRPWPGISLDELAHRIVAEAPAGHAPLIAALRATEAQPLDAGAA